MQDWIRILIPLFVLISSVIYMILKNHFVSKKDFKEFKDKHEKEHRRLEVKIVEQGKDIVEIKTNVNNMAKSLEKIEEIITSSFKRRTK